MAGTRAARHSTVQLTMKLTAPPAGSVGMAMPLVLFSALHKAVPVAVGQAALPVAEQVADVQFSNELG